ncbi:MAG: ribonuclease [Sideroxydans sp.]|nr:ribonuclease [Sideroxydans sp.]
MLRGRKAWWWILVGLILVLSLAQARNHHHPHAQFETPPVQSSSSSVLTDAANVITVAQLPPEGRETLQLIKRGGPFPYPRDGVVFSNFERVLPKQARGYYHEYTVKTPGISHRGARRIVCGEVPAGDRPMGAQLLRSDPIALPECYYTADHYQSFKRISDDQ